MFRNFIDLGGPLMWPLLGCSVLLLAVLVERTLVVVVGHRLLRRKLDEPRRCWHRRVLPFFTDVPPSVGLLGTVVGVVQSFQLADGRLSTEAVGAGLGVACMTTIYGLGIAIVAAVSGYLFDWLSGLARPGGGRDVRMSIKSFIDVLFILLLGTIVMLSQSVWLGAVEAEPLQLGGDAVSPVSIEQIEVVVVANDTLHHDGARFGAVDELAQLLRSRTVLLVVADSDVRHHRVMDVWSRLSERGLDVSLGAEPRVEDLQDATAEP